MTTSHRDRPLARRDLLGFAARGAVGGGGVVMQSLSARDGIHDGLVPAEKAAPTLEASETAAGYAGVVNPGVQVG